MHCTKNTKDKDVEFYTVYTQEPHAGEKMRSYDFSDRKQTKTVDDRVNYAKILVEDHGLKRPIIIDGFAKDNLQNTLGGGAPNSMLLIDREGKAALFQPWSDPIGLEKKLDKLIDAQ